MLDLVDELIEDGNKIRHRLECSNFQLMNRTFSLCLDKTIPIMSQLEEAFVRSESTGEFKLIVSSNKNEHFEKYLNSFGRKYGSRIQRQSQEINQKSIAITTMLRALPPAQWQLLVLAQGLRTIRSFCGVTRHGLHQLLVLHGAVLQAHCQVRATCKPR